MTLKTQGLLVKATGARRHTLQQFVTQQDHQPGGSRITLPKVSFDSTRRNASSTSLIG